MAPRTPRPARWLTLVALLAAAAAPLAPPVTADGDSCVATLQKNCRIHCHSGGLLRVEAVGWNATVAAQVTCGGATAHCEGFGNCAGVSPKVPLDGEGLCDLVVANPGAHAVCSATGPS